MNLQYLRIRHVSQLKYLKLNDYQIVLKRTYYIEYKI